MKELFTFASPIAVVAQLVEHQLPKLRVTSSTLAYRSKEKALKYDQSLFYCVV